MMPDKPEVDYAELKTKLCKMAERHAIEMNGQSARHLREIQKLLNKANDDPIQSNAMFEIYRSVIESTMHNLKMAKERAGRVT